MDVDANELLLVSQFNSMLTTDKDSLVTELHTFLNFEITEQECKFYLEMTNWNLQGAIGAFYDHSQPNRSAEVETNTTNAGVDNIIPQANRVSESESELIKDLFSATLPSQHLAFGEMGGIGVDGGGMGSSSQQQHYDNRMMDFVDEDINLDQDGAESRQVDRVVQQRECRHSHSSYVAGLPDSVLSTTSQNHILARNTRFSIRVGVKNLSSQPFSPGTSLRVVGGYYLHLNAEHLAVETLSSYGETSVYITGVVPGEVGTFNTTWSLSSALGTYFGQPLQLNIEVSDEVSSISDMMNNSHIINDDVNMDE